MSALIVQDGLPSHQLQYRHLPSPLAKSSIANFSHKHVRFWPTLAQGVQVLVLCFKELQKTTMSFGSLLSSSSSCSIQACCHLPMFYVLVLQKKACRHFLLLSLIQLQKTFHHFPYSSCSCAPNNDDEVLLIVFSFSCCSAIENDDEPSSLSSSYSS